ncbi:MAG: [protein-PII] uridylyltransferase [Sandaracinaceae bacterium]|nr:[protein-PII] uridylyltransferase [Sandaracinaceae bacterium]
MRDVSPSPALDLGRFAPTLGPTCGGYLKSYRARFEEAVRRGTPGVEGARQHARAIDGLLNALYCAADAAARTDAKPKGRLSLVAVGGYGRQTLGLHSDVDVLFLCDDPTEPYVRRVSEGLLYPLWDLGVDIGHAVRGVDETIRLALEDIRTSTTLLDLRCVAGDRHIVDELHARGQEEVFESNLDRFLDALTEDTESRHRRFGDSLFLLEPEVKQGRGGLRDLDVAEWTIRARHGVRRVDEYVTCGALVEREVERLEAAREMLWRTRNLLHLRAGRQQDRLTFADQEEIAEQLGFVDGISLAVEQFMQAYYRHARVVAQTTERMLDRARAVRESSHPRGIRVFGDGTVQVGTRVDLERPESLADDPALALRLYRRALRHQLTPHPQTRDVIARAAANKDWRERLRRSEEATQLFVGIVKHVGDAPFRGGALTELHEVGLITAMVPEFGPLVGRVMHDAYHVYTVDIHSILAAEKFRTLIRGDHTDQLGMASRLAAVAPRRLPIFLALLLHHLGRAYGRGQQARGAQMAHDVARRFGLSEADADRVSFLIREHWNFYRMATQRDVHDRETLAEVAKTIASHEGLSDLYVMTVCVLATINTSAMTTWKSRMLEELYVALMYYFEEGHDPSQRAAGIRDEVRRAFGEASAPQREALDAFIRGMPERYLLANNVESIVAHARFAIEHDAEDVAVRLGPGPADDGLELVVMTDDRPGLLADVAAVLAANRLSVVGAEVYARETGTARRAFDTFLVRRAGPGTIPADMAARLSHDIRDRLANRVSAKELISRPPKPPEWATRQVPDAPTEVSVDNEVSSTCTVVDVFTRDRPGLLSVIARVFAARELNIVLSKVNTEGERVADVFYVQRPDGSKVSTREEVKALRDALRNEVVAFHAEQGAKPS